MTAAAQERTKVTLGPATPGGGFPVYGQAVTDTIHEVDPLLLIEPRNTRGSTENVPLLEKGDVDIALVQGEVAIESIGKLPILTAMYATAGMFVVRADSPDRTIDDLRGKPVAFGASGSGLVILARYVLDGLGLDQQRDFQGISLGIAVDEREVEAVLALEPVRRRELARGVVNADPRARRDGRATPKWTRCRT